MRRMVETTTDELTRLLPVRVAICIQSYEMQVREDKVLVIVNFASEAKSKAIVLDWDIGFPRDEHIARIVLECP